VLSVVEFNGPSRAGAQDDSLPVLERVKSSACACNNHDESFYIRVAMNKMRRELG
jgi:polyphosphate kinase